MRQAGYRSYFFVAICFCQLIVTITPQALLTSVRANPVDTQSSDEVVIEHIRKLGGRITSQKKKELGLVHRVDLGYTKIGDDDMALVCRLTNLEELFLEHTRVGDAGMQHVAKAAKLRKLSLYDTRITDAGLARLSNLQRLEEVNVGETRITDLGCKALGSLRQLRYVNFEATCITDDGIPFLKHCCKLERICLSRTQITDVALQALPKSNIREIDLRGTIVSDVGIDQILLMKKVGKVNLRATDVDQKGIEKLKKAFPTADIQPED